MNKAQETEDGFETTWQVNHLAPFLLTQRLLPTLLERPDARVINISSKAAWGPMPGSGHYAAAKGPHSQSQSAYRRNHAKNAVPAHPSEKTCLRHPCL